MSAPRRHWPRYLLAISLVALLTAAASAFAVIDNLPVAGDGCASCVIPIPSPDPAPKPGKPQTFLLIGSDARIARSSDGDIGRRSDTIMLVRFGGGQPTTVLSVPRDTQVTIPLKAGGTVTGKINQAFGEGGPALTVKVVRQLLGIPINHVAVIDFEAFQRAVNRLGCLYEDVDRSYFNNVTGPGGYAAIDVKSGYQLLCGGDTLEWVRFRHTDSDLVRGARQQAFLRSAKSQIAASKLVNDSGDLIKLFRRYVQTDIHSSGATISVLKAALAASGQTTRSVRFLANESSDPTVNTNLFVTPGGVAQMRREFLHPKVTSDKIAGPSKPKPRRKTGSTRKRSTAATLAPGLVRVTDTASRQDVAQAAFDLAGDHLPLYAPTVRYGTGGWADLDPVRTYAIKAGRFSSRSYPAFRMTWSAGTGSLVGQYYGLQGTTWKDAPILQGTHHAVRRGSRTLQVYLAGSRPQLVAWSTPHAVYWVSNTLSLSLTTRQLVDIAASLERVGS